MRTQPIVKALRNGKLVWSRVPMADWQMRQTPIRYSGDFGNYWMKAKLYAETGLELNINSMDLSTRHWTKKPTPHQGD